MAFTSSCRQNTSASRSKSFNQRMKYLIHAGPGKTGTKTLQSCWNINRELLQLHGVHYPENYRNLNAHHQVAHSIVGSLHILEAIFQQDLSEFELHGYLLNIRKEAENLGCKYILLSSESFARLSIDDFKRFFKEILIEQTDTVEVLWIDREIESAMESYIWQGINTGDYWEESQREFLRNKIQERHNLSVTLVAEFASNPNINIHVIPYLHIDGISYIRKLHEIFLPVDISEQIVLETSRQPLNRSGGSAVKEKLNEFNSINVTRDWDFLDSKIVNSDKYPRERQRLEKYRELLWENENLTCQIRELSVEHNVVDNFGGWRLLTYIQHIKSLLRRYGQIKS
ncbi:unannotated protein [freshwater metagenome]|uniref:Unannotated protein n=1 Tax=freshwater metagenome TaxID=449393 RepID=A0A6J7I552_9ZZZZ